MFIGEYTYSIDQKGRVIIPVKFRDDLKKGVVITRGLDNCLFLYSISEWLILADKLSKLPLSQSKSRAFVRLMLSGADDLMLDKQGRVIIQRHLRNFAGLKKRVTIAGLYNRVEIWDEEVWLRYKRNNEKESIKIAETLEDLGI